MDSCGFHHGDASNVKPNGMYQHFILPNRINSEHHCHAVIEFHTCWNHKIEFEGVKVF